MDTDSAGLNATRMFARISQGTRTVRDLMARARDMATGSVGRRQATANSGWLLFERLTRTLLGLFVGAWVARYLGPSELGELAYVSAYVALFLPIANLSADAIIVRNISQEPKSAAVMLGSIMIMRLLLGMLCWILAVVSAALIEGAPGRMTALTAIIGGSLVFQAADVVDLWFQSQAQSRRAVMARMLAYAISNGSKIVLILNHAPLAAFAAVATLEGLVSAAALGVAYRRFKTSLPWRRSRQVALAVVSECWPFMVSGFAIMLYMRVDQIMVKELLGAHELGIYAVALPISQFWQVLPMTLATSIAPFIARQRTIDPVAYRRSMVLTFRAFFYLGVATSLTTFIVSSWLINGLFGKAYLEAIGILDAHALSNIFCFLGIAHGIWLVNERRFAVRLYGTVIAGAATIGLNMILLPMIGLLGACLAAITAQAIAAFLVNAFLDRCSFRMQVEAITFRRI
jgi:O-antigen/teichoic acid export membrane protein